MARARREHARLAPRSSRTARPRRRPATTLMISSRCLSFSGMTEEPADGHAVGDPEHARFGNERQHVDTAPVVPKLLTSDTLEPECRIAGREEQSRNPAVVERSPSPHASERGRCGVPHSPPSSGINSGGSIGTTGSLVRIKTAACADAHPAARSPTATPTSTSRNRVRLGGGLCLWMVGADVCSS